MKKLVTSGAAIALMFATTASADEWYNGCLEGVAADRPDLSEEAVAEVCSCMLSDMSQEQRDELGDAPDDGGRDGKLAAVSSETAEAAKACGY